MQARMQTMIQIAKGVITAGGVALNSVVLCLALYAVALTRLVLPGNGARDRLSRLLGRIGEAWISNNTALMRFVGVGLEAEIPDSLDHQGCYLLNCNHQSWVDIPVLQQAFNHRAPFMRFLLKKELIWVPFLGLAWWAMDFPFMNRYSGAKIKRNPGLRGKDLESARRACEKFATIPVSMMNFLEGTRFTPLKHETQKSPYTHLLKPRVGGLGQVLYSMGERLQSLIDVTIVYPDGRPGLWDLLCGRVRRVVVHARELPIPENLKGRAFRDDRGFRKDLDAWTTSLWREKDQRIETILAGSDGKTDA